MKRSLFALGMQWGDEGKGKIVDSLASKFDFVMRFQGGNNAGHTLVVGGNKYKFSVLPSGVLNPDVKLLISGGVLLDLSILIKEIESVEENSGATLDNLYIADNCHLILPVHADLECIYEKWRGACKIGTTFKGIGPCYEDKVARRGIRLMDLADGGFLRERLVMMLDYHNKVRSLESYNNIDINALEDSLLASFAKIKKFVISPQEMIDLYKYNSVLFEGAQGFMLDIDYGTYPFVTASSTLLSPGLGNNVYKLGVFKSYCTRVGSGPFPTEQENSLGSWICDKGKEFGTVTARKRRCGWLDLSMLKYASEIAMVDGLAITKLDVLVGLDIVKVCSHYVNPFDQSICQHFSIDIVNWIPVYKEFNGWDWVYDEKIGFHPCIKEYLNFIEEFLGLPVVMVSTGQERADYVMLHDLFCMR